MKYQSYNNQKRKLQTVFEEEKRLDDINVKDSLTNSLIEVNRVKQFKKTQFISNIYTIESAWTNLNYTSEFSGSQLFQTKFEKLPFNVILNIKSEVIHQVGSNGTAPDTFPQLPVESGFRKSSIIEITEVSGLTDAYNVVLNNWIWFENNLDSIPLPPYQVKVIVQVFMPVEYL